MQLTVLNRLNPYWQEKLEELQTEFSQIHFLINNSPEERYQAIENADAVVTGRFSKDDVEKAPKLKALFVPFTGLDNFDLKALKEKNIIISNTHANYRIVAEKAISLSLALLGRVVEFHNDLSKGYWNMSTEDKDTWISIQNKKCGILGFGAIGGCIADYLKPFNCKITGFKKHVTTKNSPPSPHLKAGLKREGGSEYDLSNKLQDVIDRSEIIFVCLPLTDETKGILTKEILMNMKGKYLINIGRGKLINEEGLYKSLKEGILTGAALDVWYNYPGGKTTPVFPSNFPFHELKNVVLSPHKASHTIESINGMIDDTIENLRSYFKTGTPKIVAAKDVMY